MKYVRIPKERVGVLIGHKGETKQTIEEISKVTLTIDSEEGEVVIDDSKTTDPVVCLQVEDVIRAIGRGFNPERAMKLFSDEIELFVFDIYEYVGKKESHVIRLKSRIIGSDGKTKRVIEQLTGAYLSIYGHTVSVIAEFESMDITKRAVDMLLSGSKHAKVYQFIEREMKKLKIGESW